MNPKRILVALSLSLLVAVLATWLVSRRLRPESPRRSAEVLYAAPVRAVEVGQVLQTEDTRLIAWPAEFPMEGAFSRTEDLVGREVLLPLPKGQPILDRELSALNAGIGLAGRIPEGFRAVALRSDLVVGVAGFLLPGSHVDVLVTYRSDQTAESMTATVLQNTLVLAVGHEVKPEPAGKPLDAAIVTLLLSPAESQRAVLASTQGTIHFVLRNGKDAVRVEQPPVGLSQLSRTATAPRPAPLRRQASTPPVQVKHREIEMVLAGDAGTPGALTGQADR